MSVTVTSSTVAAIMTSPGLSAFLAVVALLTLLALQVIKEIASAGGDERPPLSRGLDIAIAPLGLAFIFIAGQRLLDLLI
ncbi:MAG: hypothetical protein ACYC1C_14380 [Chloroflexota bacterium]